MKKLFLLAALSFVAVSYASAQYYFDFGYSEDSVVNVSATETDYIIEFELNMDSLHEVIHSTPLGNFSTLDLPKPYLYDYKDSVGRPMLPVRQVNLEVPEDFDMELSFSTISFMYEYIDLEKPYFPYQNFSEDTIIPFQYNESAYLTQPDWTLDNTITISPYFHFFSEKGVSIEIYPYSYDPINNRVRVIRKMQAKIPLVGNQPGNYHDMTTLHIFDWNEFYKNMRDSIGHGWISREHILIITPEEFLTDLEDYISYREERNFYVHTYTLEDIASNNNVPVEYLTSSMIISELEHIYDSFTRKPKYLILVGNPDVIPYASGYPGNENEPASDFEYSLPFYFSCLTMKLAVGRWPVDRHNTGQLSNIIENIKQFEKNTAQYTHKYNMRVDVASGSGNHEDDFYDAAYNIQSSLHDYMTFLYDGRSKTQCEIYDFVKWDLQHTLWMLIYRGHGSQHGFDNSLCITDVAGNHHISDLRYYIPPMVFAFACSTNQSNFGKNWLEYCELADEHYGAASFFGSTSVSYSYYNNHYSQRIFSNFTHAHLGDILVCATQKYFCMAPWRLTHMKRYVLMGDPTLYTKGYHRTQPLEVINYQEKESIEETDANYKIDESSTNNIIVYSSSGQVILRTRSSDDIMNLPTGIYFVEENEKCCVKIIITH